MKTTLLLLIASLCIFSTAANATSLPKKFNIDKGILEKYLATIKPGQDNPTSCSEQYINFTDFIFSMCEVGTAACAMACGPTNYNCQIDCGSVMHDMQMLYRAMASSCYQRCLAGNAYHPCTLSVPGL